MTSPLVPHDFDVPTHFEGPGFRLEPLGPQHNEADHEAWMASVDHIRSTPGFDESGDWPVEMSLDANLADLEMHARHFAAREGFTYSVLDGSDVIGCLYMYPSEDHTHDVLVRSWTRASCHEMDVVVYGAVSQWIRSAWPFKTPDYAPRSTAK